MKDDKKTPYVYQPFGALTDLEYAKVNRLWAVCHKSDLSLIQGLTKTEADIVCRALESLEKITFGSRVEAWDNGEGRKCKGLYLRERRVAIGMKEYKYHQVFINDPDDILSGDVSDFENVKLIR